MFLIAQHRQQFIVLVHIVLVQSSESELIQASFTHDSSLCQEGVAVLLNYVVALSILDLVAGAFNI